MSKTRLELLASAAQTATAQASGISVSGIKELAIFAEATSVSGSLGALYMQSSSDGGTTWFDMLAEEYTYLTSGATAVTSGTYSRNIISALTSGSVVKVWARYKTFGDYVRAAWVISGSGPSCTFSVKGIGEN
jgi:hypothetical protein